jgi:UDP-N-acetyl-2-amino-2-deoxyglucuronate dehydrogenase
MMKNLAIVGVAGYIAPRHLKAIHDTGSHLVAAVDPHDCVGRIDQYFPDARFFTEIERFDRFLDKRSRGPEGERVHYVSVCSPNYLHDAHVRMALRARAHAICEKPLVLSPWNLDALQDLEEETGGRVNAVLQLRLLPSLIALKRRLDQDGSAKRADVCLTYITRRGRWYQSSWKGSLEKSGGLCMNIGIHFFDLLLWLLGNVEASEVHLKSPEKMAGTLVLERAIVRWFLSIDAEDLPVECRRAGKHAYRSITLGGEAVEFSDGFTDLHSEVYQEILAGRGWGIADARPAIELGYNINHSPVVVNAHDAHPMLPKAILGRPNPVETTGYAAWRTGSPATARSGILRSVVS